MKDQDFINKFVSIGGAMDILGCKSRTSIEQYLKAGKITCVNVDNGANKRLLRLFFKSELLDLKANSPGIDDLGVV